MKQEFSITGMTCMNCVGHVNKALAEHPHISVIDVSLATNSLIIDSDQTYTPEQINQIVGSKYTISILKDTVISSTSFFKTYRPILLIFAYLTVICTSIELISDSKDIMRWMRHFMAGFFLIFSFFKLLDPSGFKNSYQDYDLIAKKFPTWSYIYIGFEVSMGLLYLIHFDPILTNLITLIVMSISILGVIQAVKSRQKITCACLGNVFDLPMSTVTIVEDALMILMAGFMLMMHL